MRVAEAEYLPSLSAGTVRGLDASMRKSQRCSGDRRPGRRWWAGPRNAPRWAITSNWVVCAGYAASCEAEDGCRRFEERMNMFENRVDGSIAMPADCPTRLV